MQDGGSRDHPCPLGELIEKGHVLVGDADAELHDRMLPG
jgi:hypothetical protein